MSSIKDQGSRKTMKYPVFKLEEYMAKYEFTAPYLFCCSDAETISMSSLLENTSPEDKVLWDNLSLGYTETKGLPILRDQICESLYPALNRDHILCFVGAEEGIFCALNVLLSPEDHVIVMTPCYQSLLEIPKQCTSQVTEFELKMESGWKLDLQKLESIIQSNTKLIVVNFPHNPTGQVITPDELNALISLCSSHDIWLFSDEVYRLLGNTQSSFTWPEPAACLYPKALSLGVMSKSFGLAGLRIGWIACQNQSLLHHLESLKHYTSICNSGPSEILAYFALKQKDRLLQRNNQIIVNNLQLLRQFVLKYQHLFSWIEPRGGCVGYMKFHGTDRMSFLDFIRQVREVKGVLFLPASEFGQENETFFRIGFGRLNMKESLSRVEEFIQEFLS